MRALILLALACATLACKGTAVITNPPKPSEADTATTGSGTGSTDETSGCVADCVGRICGGDGCGGVCGTCPAGEACDGGGTCHKSDCTASCDGKECGPDGCGGICGACSVGKACNGAGQCTDGGVSGCLPKCDKKVCGPDGCGSECGKCPAGARCTAVGHCEIDLSACGAIDTKGLCEEQLGKQVAVVCKAGKLVTSICDPSKGFTCGFNPVKQKNECLKDGCVPSCDGKVCGSDGCGGICGQCKPGETCEAGQCSTSCTPKCDGKKCGADGCGGVCGSCGAAEKCTAEGLCVDPATCVPKCEGKKCGSDLCGGTCGTCKAGETCTAGACAPAACVPKCDGKACGPDACGGECGACGTGQDCDPNGHCVTYPGGDCGTLSFEGQCEPGTGGQETTVRWCEDKQVKTQDCTKLGPELVCGWSEADDYYWCVKKCAPKCDGKACGPDGCGGQCGTCTAGKACDGAGQCQDASTGACGAVTSTGLCEGDTLKYCAANKLEVVGCGEYGQGCGFVPADNWNACVDLPDGCKPQCLATDGKPKVCGDDGCGNLCGLCATGTTCQTGLCVAGTSACGDLTDVGACEGTTLKYCAGDEIVTEVCAEAKQTCAFDQAANGGKGWFACVEPTTGVACGTVTEKGMCDGAKLSVCKAAALVTETCGGETPACLYDPKANGGKGAYACSKAVTCAPACEASQKCQLDGTCGCDGLDVKGLCDGDTLRYCLAKKIVTKDCKASQQTCAASEAGWANCK